MLENKQDISYTQFLEAKLLIATVEADWEWKQNQAAGPVKRVTAEAVGALTAVPAAKYIAVGKSKFYELVRNGELPQGTVIGGRPKWMRVDLDTWLAKQKRKRKDAG